MRLPTDPGSLTDDLYTLVRQAVTDATAVADTVQTLADDTKRRQSRGFGAGGGALTIVLLLAWYAFGEIKAKIDSAVSAQTAATKVSTDNARRLDAQQTSLNALWQYVISGNRPTPDRPLPPISDASSGATH